MGFLGRFRASAAPAVRSRVADLPTLKFTAIKETYPFTGDDASTIWASGYTLLDGGTGSYIKLHEQHFENPHCLLCRIAGTSHRPKALQDRRFAPGSAVTLRPDPTNAYDHNAVGVWDANGKIQIGFVPAEHSERVATDIRSGSQLAAIIMREFRRTESGPRLGLHMLIVPVGVLELTIEDDDEDDCDDDTEE